MTEPKKVNIPAIPLHDKRFQYTPAISTDVQKTWAKFGWVKPTKNIK